MSTFSWILFLYKRGQSQNYQEKLGQAKKNFELSSKFQYSENLLSQTHHYSGTKTVNLMSRSQGLKVNYPWLEHDSVRHTWFPTKTSLKILIIHSEFVCFGGSLQRPSPWSSKFEDWCITAFGWKNIRSYCFCFRLLPSVVKTRLTTDTSSRLWHVKHSRNHINKKRKKQKTSGTTSEHRITPRGL